MQACGLWHVALISKDTFSKSDTSDFLPDMKRADAASSETARPLCYASVFKLPVRHRLSLPQFGKLQGRAV